MSARRRPRQAQGQPLTVAEWAYLNDAPKPPDADDGEWWSLRHDGGTLFREGRPSVDDLWAQWRADVLNTWIAARSGTRPSLWWRFDAPEPHRRRAGGVGTPLHECSAYMLRLHLGTPTAWLDPDLAECFARIGGKPFPYPAVSAEDPPKFESQAAYLDRHALLSAAERRRLTQAHFAPEAIACRD